MVSHVCNFVSALWTVAPLTFSLVQLPPPPPFPVSKYNMLYTDSVWLGGGGGCWGLLETIFCGILTLFIWPDSEPTKIARPPKKKHRRGGGLRHINTCHKVTLQFFFRSRHFALVYYWSTVFNSVNIFNYVTNFRKSTFSKLTKIKNTGLWYNFACRWLGTQGIRKAKEDNIQYKYFGKKYSNIFC
jgi:hypothetical protein